MLFKFTNTQATESTAQGQRLHFRFAASCRQANDASPGNPWHNRVLKVVTAAGTINARYSRMVNLQRRRESLPADFKAKDGTELGD